MDYIPPICPFQTLPNLGEEQDLMAQANSSGAPNLDVRLTRSVSGSILDIDFIGGLPRPLPSSPLHLSSSRAAIGVAKRVAFVAPS